MKRGATYAVGGGLATAALLAVLSSSGGLGDVVAALGRVQPEWVLAAVAATIANYALSALLLRQLTSATISLGNAARVNLLFFGLGNVLPGAPAPGTLLAAAELRRLGLSSRSARFALSFSLWFNVRTLLAIGAFSLLVATARQHPGLHEAGLLWLAAIGVIAILAASAALAARPGTTEGTAPVLTRLAIRRPRPPPDVTRARAAAWHADVMATVGTPGHRAQLVALAAGSWIADACCLGLGLAAAGVHVDADILLLAYTGGVLGASLPLLPGGIGVVEAAIPAILHHFGAPLDKALAGTLVYRGGSLVLPAAAGALVAVQSWVTQRKAHP
jgi:uncharacterized membrane protein YbhN (UPF0104 family)